MQSYGGAAILMQQNWNESVLEKITYLIGNSHIIQQMTVIPVKQAFSEDICEFLNHVSKILMKNPLSRLYPDVITYAFWIRKTSTDKMKQRINCAEGLIQMGRGLAFHIAPSNVPVNFAYSLTVGLLTGNSNIVRVPSKRFSQVQIISEAFQKALQNYINLQPYVVLIKYEKDKEINDILSKIADIRIVWGGDATIAELRKSMLMPRSLEITFADRYSLAIINSDTYLSIADKKQVAENFYNDTYLTDQNACTSPIIVIWTGNHKSIARQIFWDNLHQTVKKKYQFQDIQGINKLTSSYLAAATMPNVEIKRHDDNLIVRVCISRITEDLMDLKDNSGYFFEYECDNILDLKPLCNNKKCQTIGYIGNKSTLIPLLISGIKGVDRVVPIGKTMDFELIWDGYDLVSQMTRIIKI